MGRLLDALTKTGGLATVATPATLHGNSEIGIAATVATVATFDPDGNEVSQCRKSRIEGDPAASKVPIPTYGTNGTEQDRAAEDIRKRLHTAAARKGVDPLVIDQHLDPEDFEGYALDERISRTEFMDTVVIAIRDAALRGTCSCDRCKARRRGGAQ